MKKCLFALLCVSMILTAVACTPEPPTYEEKKALYDDIITGYTVLLTAKQNGEELSVPDTNGMDRSEAAIAEALYGIVDACKDAKEVERLGYGYKDVDGNGVPELFLLTQYHAIKAIFTVSDNKPVLLEACYGEDTGCYFGDGGRFFMIRVTVTDHIEEGALYICRVDGDKMAYDAVCGAVYDQEKREILERFQIIDGERIAIDEETYDDLSREYEQLRDDPNSICDTKLHMPRICFPLAEGVTDENQPVADFSSYAAIRETYKAISTCLEKFEDSKWAMGEYDNLFATSDDVAFDCYNRLLHMAYDYGNKYIGYDEIDLNGDGRDELVLMDEDYNIKAIFTQKDGVPVFLGAFASDETCWLDGEGFIHVDHEEYYDLEYRLYRLDKDGDYGLEYSILSDSDSSFLPSVGYYQTQNGKTERITYEEFKETYDDYCRYSEPFEPNEQTRNVSELMYTPLTQATEDLCSAAVDKAWYKYANLEETSGNDWGAHSITDVTFSKVTDGQIDVNFKYTYTFYYPDPDREHYALEEITESFLTVTATEKDGVFVFDEGGIKGRFEFGYEHIWLVIEESDDERFAVGFHCYEEYKPQEYALED